MAFQTHQDGKFTDISCQWAKVLTYAPVPSVASVDDADFSISSLPVLLYSLGCSQDLMLCSSLVWLEKRQATCSLRPASCNVIPCTFPRSFHRFCSKSPRNNMSCRICIQLGSIVRSVLADGLLVYSISDQSQNQISRSFQREELHLLGLIFTAHIYPRDQTLERS